MKLPRVRCPRCEVIFVIEEDGRFPKHFTGDVPEWWGDPLCEASGKLVQRRKPKAKTWLAKYRDKRGR